MYQVLQIENPPTEAAWQECLTNDNQPYPFYQPSWHRLWYRTLGTHSQPLPLYFPELKVLLPLSLNGKMAHFSGGEEVADYLDAVGKDKNKALAWKEALANLLSDGVTAVNLKNIPQDSPTLSFFQALPEAKVTTEDTTPQMTLPPTFESYLLTLSRKYRHELQRKLRKFEASYPQPQLTVHYGKQTNLAILLSLMRHNPKKQAFLKMPREQFFTGLPAALGKDLIQFNLSITKTVVASTLALRHQTSLLLYNSGFDANYPGAGFYLKVKTIHWAIQQKLSAYNFLQGKERYKYELGGRDYHVYSVYYQIK